MSTDDNNEGPVLTFKVQFVGVDFVFSKQRLQQKPRYLLCTDVLLTLPNVNSFNMKADF